MYLLGLAALSSPLPALAAAMSFSPVGLFLVEQKSAKPEKISATIDLSNNEQTLPIRVQVRIFKWTKDDKGEDILEPTRDVIASPPTAKIDPQKKYTLRITRLKPAPIAGEESYRLLIDELPPAIDPNTNQQGVTILLRASLPVIFNSEDSAPKIDWKVSSQDGKLVVRGTNNGTRHVRLSQFAVSGPKGETPIEAAGSNVYLLPGKTFTWTSAAGAPAYPAGTTVTVLAARETEFPVKAQVQVSAP